MRALRFTPQAPSQRVLSKAVAKVARGLCSSKKSASTKLGARAGSREYCIRGHVESVMFGKVSHRADHDEVENRQYIAESGSPTCLSVSWFIAFKNHLSVLAHSQRPGVKVRGTGHYHRVHRFKVVIGNHSDASSFSKACISRANCIMCDMYGKNRVSFLCSLHKHTEMPWCLIQQLKTGVTNGE